MNVMTVLGPMEVEALGITLVHEHLLMDLSWPGLYPDVSGTPEHIWEPVTLENLGAIRRDYMAVRDNAMPADPDVIARELEYFRLAGGGTVVEVTPDHMRGDPSLLPELSRQSGVNIIAGTALYVEESVPERFRSMTADEIAAVFVRNIIKGFPGTDVKAGHIGEIALSSPMGPTEERALRASARAQMETGVSVSVHIGLDPELIAAAIGVLEDEEADLSRYIFDHLDSAGPVEPYLPVLERGITVSFDTFGHVYYTDNGAYDTHAPWYYASDSERLLGVKSLIERGFERQVLLSHDIGVKMQLRTYGGWGYAHILEHVRPMLEHAGINGDTFRVMMEDNPARLLGVED